MGSLFSQVDLALLRMYDRPGPRYTSYPTAPLFKETFTAEDFRDEIRSTNAPATAPDVSLYYHFPFCDTLCYFCGCTMLVTRDRNRIEQYNRYLGKEMDLIAPAIGEHRKVVQVVSALDLSGIIGTQIYVGYGVGSTAFGVAAPWNAMLTNGTYNLVYTVQ